MEKTVAEVPLTEAVKPKQLEMEQQRRQEAMVQKDRVNTSFFLKKKKTKTFCFFTTIRPYLQNCTPLVSKL